MRLTLASLLLLLASHASTGQDRRWSFSAGGLVAFVTGQDTTFLHKPAPGLCAELIYNAPLGERVRIHLGVSYLQKGYGSNQSWETGNVRAVYNERMRYDMISLPLRASVRLHQRKKLRYWLEGGINYGFLVDAAYRVRSRVYLDGKKVRDDKAVRHVETGLAPQSSSRVPTGSNGVLHLFNPAVSLALKVAAGKHYSLRVFYEYNLYDASMYRPAGSHLNLNAAGLLVGVQL